MVNLLMTINFFGLELNWDESNTMVYLMIAVSVLFVLTLIVIGLLIWLTRPRRDKVIVKTVVTESKYEPPEETVEEDDGFYDPVYTS